MERQGLVIPAEEIPGRAMGTRLRSLEDDQKKRVKGMARLLGGGLACVFAGSWGILAWMAIHHTREIAALKQQIVEQNRVPHGMEEWHDLRVVTRIDDSNFSALTLNPRTKVWKLAYYRICPPITLDADVVAGATIISVDWQVDRVHGCKDISSKFAGFNFWRKPNATLILTDWNTP